MRCNSSALGLNLSRAGSLSRTWLGGLFLQQQGTEPPHVHIRKGGSEAKFWVSPVRLESSDGLKVKELVTAERLVKKHEAKILEKWNEHIQ
jgi:hypothetical protein